MEVVMPRKSGRQYRELTPILVQDVPKLTEIFVIILFKIGGLNTSILDVPHPATSPDASKTHRLRLRMFSASCGLRSPLSSAF